MAALKTQVTDVKPRDFIDGLADETRKKECRTLLALFRRATGKQPKMWGTSIVGYGSYHYKSERSRQEGDWPLTGFSPRKQNLAVYIMPGFEAYGALLATLGPHTTGSSCLYIKRLADVDLAVLETLVRRSVADMKKRYPA